MVKVIDLNKITHEMIKNGTWEFKNGVFRHALGGSIIGFDGENFYFPDYFSRKQQKEAKKKLEFVLGLNTDLEKFYSEIEDSKFAFLIREFYGLTIPKAPDKYQALVETIAQQQVSFEFAMRTIRNLVKLAGKKLENLYIFPNPQNILNLSEEKLRETKLGYRAGYIRHLTREYLEGNLNLDLEELDEKEAIKYLTKFKGIGRWSAELFLAYGLGKNVYPAGDLGMKRGIAKIFGKNPKEVKEKDVREIIEPYGKWKSLLAFYILCYDRKTETVKKRGKN
ncbi:DNA-3-methyladenine glycosylase 2 family protein [Thermococci archaeon]|nr:MAG: 3-methyladenine DNA glycosylase [Archaeoglobales archaeon ex4484_92]RLF76775.1 MAG: DNA-3-methyladenine glycosylase 2 family protein [Thermococci archaeon]RLF82160.1 MAG: DNA-3-methyladenine glycosylase 2 family protein [Thermococci archaeon]RLF83095.1 MAG: DNA-3-methyladenine glycosylase 2 family protein [Thermococci archaeon]RLF85304.1 MAG: DNA-3-methyladenine glycosylase 2 family protein [Thermococci archaeon]